MNPPAGLKISCPAYSHLATVEECDNTASEVLVVTVFYLVGSVISQFGLETVIEERDYTRGKYEYVYIQNLS